MVTVLDLTYALLFAAAFPLLDYFVFLPGFRQRATIDAESAKSWFWKVTLGALWVITAIGVAVWIGNARSWIQIGFSVPSGWRAWSAIGICGLFVFQSSITIRKVTFSEKARASVRKQFGDLGLAGSLMPSTNSGLAWWIGVSLSAGLCEEFLFRGYLIWVLMPFLGWWGAAAISVFLFAIAHAYQGSKGIFTAGIVGVALTATVAIFKSLIPAIALHALIDLSSGCIAWLAFREQGKPIQ
jgi:membrane protease YdiL (CAAX protease family)